MSSLDAEASADNLSSSSHGRFSCAASSPSTPQSPKSEYHMQPTRFRGRCYLRAEFNTVDLLPQGLVGADLLRERSKPRDTELKTVD